MSVDGENAGSSSPTRTWPPKQESQRWTLLVAWSLALLVRPLNWKTSFKWWCARKVLLLPKLSRLVSQPESSSSKPRAILKEIGGCRKSGAWKLGLLGLDCAEKLLAEEHASQDSLAAGNQVWLSRIGDRRSANAGHGVDEASSGMGGRFAEKVFWWRVFAILAFFSGLILIADLVLWIAFRVVWMAQTALRAAYFALLVAVDRCLLYHMNLNLKPSDRLHISATAFRLQKQLVIDKQASDRSELEFAVNMIWDHTKMSIRTSIERAQA